MPRDPGAQYRSKMQAAEMLCGTRVYHLAFLISLAIGYVHSLPIQTLPSIPGYVPVYIRHGDQPLEEINPALAEAFHEELPLRKATVLPNVNGPTDISLEQEDAHENKMEAIRVRQAEINEFLEDEKSNVPTKMDTDALPTQSTYLLIKEARARLEPIREKFRNFLKKLRGGLTNELKPSRPQDFNKVAGNHKDKIVQITHVMPPHPPVIPKGADLVHKDVSIISNKEPAAKKLNSNELSKFQKTFGSVEPSHEPETERADNQSLEPK